jgi:hypothetical protein
MRLATWRVLLASLLVATIALSIFRKATAQPDISSKVMEVIAQKGWIPLELPVPDGPLGKSIRFHVVECNGVGHVFFADLGLQAVPILDQVIGPGYTWRVAYLGRIWGKSERLGLRLEWLRERTLSIFGYSQFYVTEIALVISGPPDCQVLNEIDWSAAWRISRRSI